MNADVEKAVEAADQACATYRLGFEGRRHWQTIRQALRDHEAEIARLKSAWHVETLNAKDRLIAFQEAENDRVKAQLSRPAALLARSRAYHVEHECPDCPTEQCDACLIDDFLARGKKNPDEGEGQ